MRILTRYILKEVLSHAFIGGALFTFVLFMRDLPHLLELVVRNSASLGTVVEIFLLTLPNMFTVTIPMAVLVGILLGLSRLAADSEITAMRASGIGVWSFVGIVAIVSIMGWGIGLANTLYFAPRASRTTLRLEAELLNAQASYEVQRGVFYEDFKNYVLYVQDVRAGLGRSQLAARYFSRICPTLKPRRSPPAPAPPSSMAPIRRPSCACAMEPNTRQSPISPTSTTSRPFRRPTCRSRFPRRKTRTPGRNESPILAMSNQELLARSRMPGGQWYLIELYKRFAYPAACLVLMLVGVPLGISSKRGGKSAGFVLTIVLVFVYYFLSSTGTALARQNKLPAVVGVWLANVALCDLRRGPAAADVHRRRRTCRADLDRKLVQSAGERRHHRRRTAERPPVPSRVIRADASPSSSTSMSSRNSYRPSPWCWSPLSC